jgi:hypothetical protein
MKQDSRRERRKKAAGMEIFEIQPVILGGSPTDPANKTILAAPLPAGRLAKARGDRRQLGLP